MKIKKIKTTFLIFSGLIILSFAIFAFAEENSSGRNIFMDSDQDGLANNEEKTYGTDPYNPDTDGDGYSDGVEVKSGYDPLKPAPGDKIVTDNKIKEDEQVAGTSTEKDNNSSQNSENLTEKVSSKVTSLINKSQTENSDVKIEDLDAIIDEITSQELTFKDLPEIDEKTIKIKKQNYSKLSNEEQTARKKEDALKYLTAVSYIMVANAPQKISSTDDVQELANTIIRQVQNFSFESGNLSFLDNYIEKEKNVLKQLETVEVPEEFLELHKRGIKLANYSISLRNETNLDKNDPIKSMIYLSKANGILSLSNSLFNEVMVFFKKYGITGIPVEL